MKKILSILALSILFIGCSKDTDDENQELQEFIVTLNVDSNYHFNEFTESFRAFLSDQNGNILDTAELQIGQQSTLMFAGDPAAEYDLSYMYYADIDIAGEELYTLITFSNIDAGNYTIGPSLLLENSRDEIYINLNNTGYPCEIASGTAGSATFGPENGGYFNFKGNLVGSPRSDFYISFKNPNEDFQRYFWREDVSEGFVFNLDYTTLPEIQNIVSVQLPSNSRSSFVLEGLINNDPNKIHHSISIGNYLNGNNTFLIPVPSNIFDSYLFRYGFGDDDYQYFKFMRAATFPNTVSIPELSFSVNNQTESNFNMTTTGNANIYNIIFRDSNTEETISVAHQIYGEVAPEVTFSKKNLRTNIQQTYPDLTGFETLPLGSVSLTHYSENMPYKEILKYRIQGKVYEIPEGGFYEGVSRQFD